MKSKLKLLVLILAFAALLAAAFYGYRKLGAVFLPTTAPQSEVQSGEETDLQTNADASVGQPAADFTVYTAGGEAVSLSQKQGKPVVLNFWASWCHPCCNELPDFEAAAKQYGDRVEFMMINLTDGARDTVEGVEAFLQENGYTFPVYFDTGESAATAYSVYYIPHTVIVSADGKVLYSQASPLTLERLQTLLDSLIG